LKLRKVKTHGGKWYLARKIIERLPGHHVFVEPFAGGLSVLLNKPPVSFEVASDRDARLIGFYRELQARPDEFLERVLSLEYDRETFDWSLRAEAGDGPLESAVKFLVRRQFSRGALGRDFAWSDRLRGGQPGDRNAWHTLRLALPAMAERLRHVELRCQDAIEVIREHDGPGTLFYLDPPYLPSTRTTPEVYDHELIASDHFRLIETVTRCRGMVAISGYGNLLYDQALETWERVEWNLPNHSGQAATKQRRVEVLWLNPNCRT
jgi:DNA adenine methylase